MADGIQSSITLPLATATAKPDEGFHQQPESPWSWTPDLTATGLAHLELEDMVAPAPRGDITMFYRPVDYHMQDKRAGRFTAQDIEYAAYDAHGLVATFPCGTSRDVAEEELDLGRDLGLPVVIFRVSGTEAHIDEVHFATAHAPASLGNRGKQIKAKFQAPGGTPFCIRFVTDSAASMNVVPLELAAHWGLQHKLPSVFYKVFNTLNGTVPCFEATIIFTCESCKDSQMDVPVIFVPMKDLPRGAVLRPSLVNCGCI